MMLCELGNNCMHSGAMDRTVVAALETTGILDLQKYDWQHLLG
jgi:hypothetical protein